MHIGNGCIAIEWSRPRPLDLGPYADGSIEQYMLTAQIEQGSIAASQAGHNLNAIYINYVLFNSLWL